MRVGDTVIFQSVKVPAMYVHCDTDVGDDESHSEWAQEHQLDVANELRPPGDDDNKREVNVAASATRFKLVPVATHQDVKNDLAENTVRGGEYVEIYQRQSQVRPRR